MIGIAFGTVTALLIKILVSCNDIVTMVELINHV